jgi:hypothetical protein
LGRATRFTWLALLLPAGANAQHCFLARPLPACRWYWVTESGTRWPLSRPRGAAHDQEYFWSLGVAKNVGTASSIGLTLTLGTDYVESGTYRLSLQPRYRRWLAPLVLDLGAGPILVGSGDAPVGLRGISTYAALGYRSLVAVDAGFDAHRRNLTGRTSDGYVGLRFGSLPGVVFGVVMPVILIVRALGSGPD